MENCKWSWALGVVAVDLSGESLGGLGFGGAQDFGEVRRSD